MIIVNNISVVGCKVSSLRIEQMLKLLSGRAWEQGYQGKRLHKEISSLKLKSGFHTEQWGLTTVYVRTINLLIHSFVKSDGYNRCR